ncbi:MAG TPA: UDP-N-acetylmuramate dehydrogenase [Bacteroidia bacterium]|jgi:UDP-N-acetylmuramate dehydrogenase|nr:UDP-N-acetylmuramate dehydrogenase [Bacteroidia bacterium]
MIIQENYSLKSLNTFGIEALAQYFSPFSSIDQLTEIISDKRFATASKLILGGGSNLLFTKNVDGLVLKNELKGIELLKEDSDHYYVRVAAGEVWHNFVLYCIEHNYAGLENLSLIPGNVGASPMQNIGAYGVEIKDCFQELQAYHIKEKKLYTFNKADCKFGYRESVFKQELKNQFIITSVTYRLDKKPVYKISYGAIEKELEAKGVKELSIRAISDAVCSIRRSKLPNPAVIGNAGSFFKNPEIVKSKFEFLKSKFPEIVGYPVENGNIKLAAGWLIEKCGWKGKRKRDAGVHALQALVLVNYGNATGKEIYALSQEVMDSVMAMFGVTLEREVNIL